MSGISYKRAGSDDELRQILELQRANSPAAVTEEEIITEGFVTVQHSFEILKAMNDKCPHVIAVSEGRVVGYTLCMLPDFKEDIDVLKPMFRKIEEQLSPTTSYIVMGQVCIDKAFRKRGIFRGLYNHMKQVLQPDFDLLITEVDVANPRSMQAHYAIGFELLHAYSSGGQDWELIFWDWN